MSTPRVDPGQVFVRRLTRGEHRPAADVLATALFDDPAWRHVLPDAGHRRTALRSLVGIALSDSGRHARVAVLDDRIVAVAVWQPPGRYPMSAWRQARAIPALLPMTVRLGREARAAQRFGDALDDVFPDVPVRYLQVLGVAPGTQGRGVGSQLLTDGLREADAANETTYLETGKQANVAFYQASGFRLLDDGGPLWPDGPTMWRMQRPSAG